MMLTPIRDSRRAYPLPTFRKAGREPVPPPGLPPEYPAYLKPIRINRRDTIERMHRYLDEREPQVSRWLYSSWTAQADAIKYQELRNAITGQTPFDTISEEWLDAWREEYAVLVNEKLAPMMEQIGTHSADVLQDGIAQALRRPIPPGPFREGVAEWVNTRSMAMVKRMSEQQLQAARNLFRYYTLDKPLSAQEMGRVLRATVGLTEGQADAVKRYREELLTQGMDAAKVEHQVQNYSHFLHRRRADLIARTETAHAYAEGQRQAIAHGIDHGFLNAGELVGKWQTAEDERVCDTCGGLDGMTAKHGELFGGIVDRPPAHPRCRCFIELFMLEDQRGR